MTTSREAQLDTEQNAWVVKNAEHYYCSMVQGGRKPVTAGPNMDSNT